MTRHYLLLLVALFAFPLATQADRVTEYVARQKAGLLFAERGTTRAGQIQLSRETVTLPGMDVDDPLLYVFNREGGGFAIVSGDDRTFPILGFSDTGHLSDRCMPANLRWWLGCYGRSISQLGHCSSSRSVTSFAEAKEEIAPRLKTAWGQDAPYNLHTPELVVEWNGSTRTEHAATGCVATAMAQVLNYYRYPLATMADTPSRDSVTVVPVGPNAGEPEDSVSVPWTAEAVPAGSVIAWDDIAYVYDTNSTDAQKEAVSRLMQYCGAAVKMNYGMESGANILNMAAGLYADFGYRDLFLRFGIEFPDTQEWIDAVYEELSASGPVIFGGQADKDVERFGAHEFVIDGYHYQEGQHFFYVNWGWDGDNNGYFLLDVMAPGWMKTDDGRQVGFAAMQHFVGGMGADGVGRTSVESLLFCDTLTLGARGKTYDREIGSGNFLVSDYEARFLSLNKLHMTASSGIAIYDTDGNRVSLLSFSDDIDDEYALGSGYIIYPEDENDPLTLGSGLRDGTYLLKLVCKATGADDWQLMTNAENNVVMMTVNGDHATFAPAPTGIISMRQSTIANGDTRWFDLMGRCLNGQPATKGVYVNGGRIRVL